jgi:tRNA uridine 5-carboxymethylaminomethyl modification enzyme
MPGGQAPVVAIDVLARPEGSLHALRESGIDVGLPRDWSDCLEVRVRYRGYIERQRRTAERATQLEEVILPEMLWDSDLGGVSREAREKLVRWRPASVGQASRIAGISPADVAILLVHVRRLASRDAGPLVETQAD